MGYFSLDYTRHQESAIMRSQLVLTLVKLSIVLMLIFQGQMLNISLFLSLLHNGRT